MPILERENKAIILPKSVGLELMKLANDSAYCRTKYPDNPTLNALARQAINNLNNLIKSKIIEVYADPDDGNFADNVFIHVLTKKRLQYDMLLITQDKGLASEALRIGKDSSAVRGVNPTGKPVHHCTGLNYMLIGGFMLSGKLCRPHFRP